ncbi:MAG: CDP-archaeol synthase [Betaproteobacteria bacterium]|nr:CDP-archaeol synthase [Betaproteobacteria bacterium]
MTAEFIPLLLLIIIANGAPVLVRIIFGNHLNTPVDLGFTLPDGHPVFGSSKTWRGIFAALLMTSIAASLMNYPFVTGFLIASYAVIGDLSSSFIKRRFSMAPSSKAPILDQVPESLLPAFMMMRNFDLELSSVLWVSFIFLIVDLVMTYILYHWKILKKSSD